MKTRLGTGLFILLLAVMSGGAADSCRCQDAVVDSLPPSRQCQAVFDDVQSAISSGNVALLASHFGAQIDISLRGSESGTFSANQAFYVFDDFFRTRKFGRLRFSTIGQVDASPYATGSAELMYNGTRQLVQVYVALSTAGEKHVITQLNIY